MRLVRSIENLSSTYTILYLFSMLIFRSMKNHLEQSHNQYKCSHCNQTFNSLTLFNQHTETACPQMIVNCKLQQYGCKEQVYNIKTITVSFYILKIDTAL
jgi:hypothetical protein